LDLGAALLFSPLPWEEEGVLFLLLFFGRLLPESRMQGLEQYTREEYKSTTAPKPDCAAGNINRVGHIHIYIHT